MFRKVYKIDLVNDKKIIIGTIDSFNYAINGR